MVCKLVIESEKNKDILKKMNEKIEENKMNIDIKICPKCFSQMKKTETDDPEKFLKNYISNDSVETIKHYLKNNNNTYPYYKCKNKECNNVLVDSSILKEIHNNLAKIHDIKKMRMIASIVILILIYVPLTLIAKKFTSEDFFLTTNFVIDFWLRFPLLIIAGFIMVKYIDGIYNFKNWKKTTITAIKLDLMLGVLAIIIPILRIFSY